MATAASSARCKCCGESDAETRATLVSPFLAFRGWGGEPVPTDLLDCARCGFRSYRRVLTDDEARAFYRGYRDESYYRERNRFEPFYTRAVHDGLAHWLSSAGRRADLAQALSLAGVGPRLPEVLDFGGGSGILIRDIDAARKAVFDMSGTAADPGVEAVKDPAGARWSLVICAQVLEHVSDPKALLEAIRAACRPSGAAYFEVPDQHWRWPALGAPRWWIEFLCGNPAMLLAADVYSTFFRVKFGFLPPFGFVPMREHVNFFSPQALSMLASRCGFRVLSQGRHAAGSFFLVAAPA